MDTLPFDERQQVWDETERNFWSNIRHEWETAQTDADKKHQQAVLDHRVEMATLIGRQSQLAETRTRLAKELAQVEEDLARLAQQCDDRANQLHRLEKDYHEDQQKHLETREKVTQAMTSYFQKMRSGSTADLGRTSREPTPISVEHRLPPPSTRGSEGTPEQSVGGPIILPSHKLLVDIVHADGSVVGPVLAIEPWNQWVRSILELPIRRPVKIRRGRKFNQEHLSSIYERTEAKGVKWLSCMIQATGKIQSRRCISCEKNQGAFDDCVIIGGEMFNKCGNCEWNRQGLQGPPTPVSRVLPSTESEMRTPLPANPRDHLFNSGFTPANIRSRPPSLDLHTPTAHSTGDVSPQPYAPKPNPGWVYDPSCEINRHNLVLRDNGVVFTFPPCVEDVPVAKIDQNHPYWERSWTDVKTLIEPALQSWREKYTKAVGDESRGEKRGTSKYQIGRQVNRGIKILKFLETGDISPYQLLAKQYLQSGKGGITSYDTLFRLVDTLEELEKYRLDIKPVDWLRHRLHELILEQGADFNFPRTIHDFYHDEKLKYIRDKCGFKNIGRPSSGKPPRHVQNGTPQPKPLKRKMLHSQTSTPADTPISGRSPLVGHMSLPPDSPSDGVTIKRLRHISPALASDDELYTAELSDADSWCGSPLTAHDWRLYQVKTRLYTSSTKVTQYWSWLDDTKRFEHQVLTEISPAKWGVLREPINFDLRLDEMVQITYNLKALHISILVNTERPVIAKKDGKPRGHIMAAFKRERTMKRFLRFCRNKGVRLAEIGGDEIMRMWDLMPSEQLPDRDEDAEELKG
ncbi:hypothetical protein B0I35DRAFT_453944 [Stachybotrys elegans]|uniref:Uncharacterized protein n=1 Tax=Stachybotrys elegans TaxID=80388 RepID=A0A8K0SKE1_9HYPO|nr:hypothetical protein B0I35DRAFT_453944 [Stachybotrys elegans]